MLLAPPRVPGGTSSIPGPGAPTTVARAGRLAPWQRGRVRPLIEEIFQALLARHRDAGRVHLNDISEVIGGRAVTYEEVEALIDRLEAAGLRVGEPLDERDVASLRTVLESARGLQARLGRRPTVAEIAAETGRPEHEIRRALEDAARARSGRQGTS